MVRRHQAIITTPITVVAAMIFRALSLDSRIPRMFALQKYRVIAAAIATEPQARRDRERDAVMAQDLVGQADDVLSGRDAADRTGQDVVKQKGRDRHLGERAAHRLFHDPIDAAADEHRAALDVDAPHRVAEQHDRQDEPWGRLADLRLDDPADVIGRARQIAQDDRRVRQSEMKVSITLVTTSTRPGVTTALSLVDAASTPGEDRRPHPGDVFLEPWDVTKWELPRSKGHHRSRPPDRRTCSTIPDADMSTLRANSEC